MRRNLNNISLRQLQAMEEVARCRSFVEAAGRLHLTPSALSETIKALETNVGLRLFDRTTRSVQLTAAGEAFLEPVRSSLGQMEKAVQLMGELQNLERGRVCVIGATSALSCLVAPCLADFARRAPRVQIEMRTSLSMQMLQSLREGDADFCVASIPAGVADDVECYPLLMDRFGLVAVSSHPAVQVEEVDLRNVTGVPYVGLITNSLIDVLLAQQHGLSEEIIQPAIRVDGTGSLAAVLLQGVGVSILPALSVHQMELQDLKYCPLVKSFPMRTIQIARLRNRSLTPAAQALWDLVKANAQTLKGMQGIELPGQKRQKKRP